ncbi:hypothetical protein PRUPE_1G039400 [Prunus persica]|uniref:Uncharacterized protein n=1 Tax=Prunus persica TaxID=3760 RepID=A0A251QSC9_PRUPE|nr:hypothetical protein PRUPE_1G039400 [Prunus persica]
MTANTGSYMLSNSEGLKVSSCCIENLKKGRLVVFQRGIDHTPYTDMTNLQSRICGTTLRISLRKQRDTWHSPIQ